MSTTVLPKRYSPSVFNGVAGMIDNDQGGYVRFHDCVTYGTACAEAAKATGTEGEQSTLIGMEVSMDVSIGDEDFDHRIFGRIEGLMAKGDGTDIILAVEESRNFATDTQAARQPAPVAEQGDLPLPKGLTDFIYSADLYAVLMDAQHATNAPATTWMANKMIVKLDKLKEDMRDHLDRECKEASIAATNRSQQ